MGDGGVMARRAFGRGVLAVLAGGAAMLLSGCDVDSPMMGFMWQEPYYPKLKVEVETPEGIKTGYSVIEVKWDKAGRGFNVRGEAIVVDLPGGQTLFVLLRSANSADWAAYLHQIVKLENSPEDQALYYSRIAANRQVWTVPRTKEYFGNKEVRDNYPYFVRFRDINDPKSVEQVDPDNLAKTFGQGVKLKSFTLKMADEPVTVGIEKRLGWLNEYARRGARLNGDTSIAVSTNELSDNLGTGSFKAGFNK
jgi:hypothetical protein